MNRSQGDLNIDKTKRYLKRINYQGPLDLTARTLCELQLAHLYAVPFENLSIHWEEPITLDDNALFDKIVVRRRGGFCYELNGLFAWLLRSLGFEVSMLSAGVANGEGGYSPYFDHMALMVKLEEPWLVDVGFGDTFREPLRLNSKTNQMQNGGAYRIDSDGDIFFLMEQKIGQKWKAGYRFKLQAFEYADYADRCHYHQTSPESHFKQRRICSQAIGTGRLTLSETQFIITSSDGHRQEQPIVNEETYAGILSAHFGISIKQ